MDSSEDEANGTIPYNCTNSSKTSDVLDAFNGNSKKPNVVPIMPIRFPNLEKEVEEIEKEDDYYITSSTKNSRTAEEDLDQLADILDFNDKLLLTDTRDNKENTARKNTRKTPLKCTLATPKRGIRRFLDDFVVPRNNHHSCTKPKIQCSISIDSALRTPLNECRLNSRKSASTIRPSSSSSVSTPPLPTLIIRNVKYRIINTLGIGGTATVFACINARTKEDVAIKRVLVKDERECLNEVKILEHLRDCDRVIRMFNYEKTQMELNIVLEKGFADLSQNLREIISPLPFYQLIYFWINMVLAVEQIHSKGVVHSDLKPGNFIWARSGTLKLIDFGIATLQENDSYAIKNVAVGSISYISPEALISEISNHPQSPNCGKLKYKVGYKSDIWSLGCILYKMGFGETPFHRFGTMEEKVAAISCPTTKIFYPEDHRLPAKIVNTMKRCLQFHMDLRPTINELLFEYKNYY